MTSRTSFVIASSASGRMTLPFWKRAAAMASAIAVTAVIIQVIADIGHPPPSPGVTLLSRWLHFTGGAPQPAMQSQSPYAGHEDSV